MDDENHDLLRNHIELAIRHANGTLDLSGTCHGDMDRLVFGARPAHAFAKIQNT